MSLWYKLLYGLGVTPWEEDPPNEEVADQVSVLFSREESAADPPYGSALDLGCGTGMWSVELAARGWQVTGVDIVPKAIRLANERRKRTGATARFVEGDVTALDASTVGSGFQFIVDFECFNHLNDAQRRAVGRGVTAVAAPDASILMLVWEPRRRWFLPPGANVSDLERAFPDWAVVDEDAFAAQSSLPFWLKHIQLSYYRLRRRPFV